MASRTSAQSIKSRLEKIEKMRRNKEAENRIFHFTVQQLAEKPLWKAVDSILELERFGSFEKLKEIHYELNLINEKSPFKEYYAALALEGLVRSIIENDQSEE